MMEKERHKHIPTVSCFSMGLEGNNPKFKASGTFSCFGFSNLHNPKSRVLFLFSFPTIHNRPFPLLDPVYSLISSRYFFFQTDFHPIYNNLIPIRTPVDSIVLNMGKLRSRNGWLVFPRKPSPTLQVLCTSPIEN
jgi:hypothetical protein